MFFLCIATVYGCSVSVALLLELMHNANRWFVTFHIIHLWLFITMPAQFHGHFK